MLHRYPKNLLLIAFAITSPWAVVTAQDRGKSRDEEIRLGSATAKGGFQNEDQIRDKFNDWKNDEDAKAWLRRMNYALEDIVSVTAAKPHGEKADVEVSVRTKKDEHIEGISIKLVSNPNGFNQIDKRWLKTYVQKWNIPDEVHRVLQLYVGEVPPTKPGKDPRRMFLTEMDDASQRAVIEFFRENRDKIVSYLFAGEGEHAAQWIMVTLQTDRLQNLPKSKSSNKKSKTDHQSSSKDQDPNDSSDWILCSTKDASSFFGGGDVQITAAGNLKIGRITMQRKGGDNGRESANMLQFKINPVELFELRR